VALEDQGQQVILRYLTGDQVPQTQKEFQTGEQYYRAARLLTPESLFLEGRQSFLRGRSLLFDKNYAQAADLLEGAVRIDPGGSHAYNALGIAYLEQADFARADPGVPGRSAPRAALDLPAPQPGAVLYRNRRFRGRHPHLQAGHQVDAPVFVSAV